MDKFTYLDRIGRWTIERMVEPSTNKVRCRASIVEYGNWFADRIRLDKEDELVLPKEDISIQFLDTVSLEKVRHSLKNCRSGFIYME